MSNDKNKQNDNSFRNSVRKKLKPDNTKKKKDAKKEPQKTFFVWVIVIIMVILGLKMLQDQTSSVGQKISYSKFKELMHEEKILNAVVTFEGLNHGELRGQVASAQALTKYVQGQAEVKKRTFVVKLPFLDSDMLAEWDSLGIQYEFKNETVDFWSIVMSFSPIIIIILIWVFMFKQMQGGQRGIFQFGKSKAKLHNMDLPKNSFNDVAGVEEAKAELEEIIDFLKDPNKFKRLGGKIPKGVLLLGPPGTGKTLLARAVAGEADVPFYSMSGSDFVEMFVGVGASRVRDLFETAKKNSPSLIFIDEIDAVGRQRGTGLGGGHDEREQTLNQMLVEMDGFEANSGVILIAATNRPDVLDPALLRPGRFDRQVIVDVPDINGRKGILKVHTKNIPLAPDVELMTIARGTPGFVGADLANLVNEAALMASRFNQKNVTMLDFEEAKDKVMMGTERRSMVLSDKEKKNTAYHEAGHAICTLNCEEADALHKVTIIPRGRALGITFSLPNEDKHSHSKKYILDRVCILMGGRAAEELIFDSYTTGASNDIKQATNLIRKLICDFGMTKELGPLSYSEGDEQVFLGKEFNKHKNQSEKTTEKIDVLMRKFADEQYDRAKNILTKHSNELELLAKALLEHETLDAVEINKIINGETLLEAKKNRPMPKRKKRVKKDTDVSDQANTEEIKPVTETVDSVKHPKNDSSEDSV